MANNRSLTVSSRQFRLGQAAFAKFRMDQIEQAVALALPEIGQGDNWGFLAVTRRGHQIARRHHQIALPRRHQIARSAGTARAGA